MNCICRKLVNGLFIFPLFVVLFSALVLPIRSENINRKAPFAKNFPVKNTPRSEKDSQSDSERGIMKQISHVKIEGKKKNVSEIEIVESEDPANWANVSSFLRGTSAMVFGTASKLFSAPTT